MTWNLTFFLLFVSNTRLTMWNSRGMVLEAQICIILIFLSDSKVSKNICFETFRGMNIILFLTSSGWYEYQLFSLVCHCVVGIQIFNLFVSPSV